MSSERLEALPWGREVEADPIVTTFVTKYVLGWPEDPSKVPDNPVRAVDRMPLSDALMANWPTDRYVVGYRSGMVVGEGSWRRLNKPALVAENLAKIEGGIVELPVLIVEVDCPTKEDPATIDPWFEQERPKIAAFLIAQPGLIVFRTRGGYRLLGRLWRVFELRGPEDDLAWARFFQAVVAMLGRTFGIVADPLDDWTRLQGLPRATRQGNREPEDREAFGDPERVGTWDLSGIDESDWAVADQRVSGKRPVRTDVRSLVAGGSEEGQAAGEDLLAYIRGERLGRLTRPVAKMKGGTGRGSKMLVVAAVLRNDYDLPDDQAWAEMQRYNAEVCDPPLEEDRLVKAFENGFRYAKGARGSARADYNVRLGALRRVVAGGGGGGGSEEGGGGSSGVALAPAGAAVAVAELAGAPSDRPKSNTRIRPTVQVGTDLEEMARKAKEILAADPSEDARLYQRDGHLVQLALDDRPDKNGDPIGASIVPVEDVCVVARLSTLSRWVERTEGTEKRPSREKDVLPPAIVARRVMSSRRWPVRALAGIAECPTLRADGSLISRAGFDEATGIFLWPAPELMGITIPEMPTPDEARAAYRLLRDIFREFPFVKECHGAAAVAFLLSVILRGTMDGPCPIFALKAPQSDSGKSLLVDSVSIIALGREAPRQGYYEDDAEQKKEIAATLGSGRQLCLVDNVTGRFGGQAWDLVLSAKKVDIREFGQNTAMTTREARTVFCVTGNGLRVKDDMGKRTCPIDIDPKTDKPGERKFDRPDLLGYCRENRRELVRAALVLGAEYLRRGMPGARQTTGPFRSWSRGVRGMIERVTWEPGMPIDPEDGAGRGVDPWGGQSDFVEEADTKKQADAALAAAWWEAFKDSPKTTQEVFASPSRVLREAIEDVLGKDATPQKLGNHLGDIKNVTHGYDGGSYRFERGSARERRWRVVKLR